MGSKDRTREMRAIILLSLASLALGAPRPQEYSGDTSALDIESLGGTIQEIFGKQSAGGYGATEESGDLNTQQEDQTIDVLVQVVKEGFPGDYVEPNDNLVEDKATVEVDTVFEHCHEYTESLGYECVPYYQCHNGTIITDGAGLIDIRNGFASLTPEDSKCPGFLDVCCKDPDFIPPPPPPVIVPKYIPQCGKRNTFGLGARIQGFTEGESQFGECPHMCAVLHAKTVEQEAGYAGEPEIVNLYQCGGSLIAPGVVLTAAHCVDKFKQNPGEVKIRCGDPPGVRCQKSQERLRRPLHQPGVRPRRPHRHGLSPPARGQVRRRHLLRHRVGEGQVRSCRSVPAGHEGDRPARGEPHHLPGQAEADQAGQEVQAGRELCLRWRSQR